MKPILYPLLFCTSFLWGQNAFIKEYGRTDFGNYTSANIYNIIELDSKFHVFGGASYITASIDAQHFSLLHSIIDKNGTILTTQIDSTNFENAYYLSTIFINNSLYCVGKKWNDDIFNQDQRKFIQKMNKDGVVQWTKTFGDSSWSFWDNYTHQIYTHENNLIVFSTGNDGISQTVDFSLLNIEGNLISIKQFKTSQNFPYLEKPIASEQTVDGFLVIMEGSGGPPQAKRVQTLLKLDNQGNELWRKSLNNYDLPERENLDSVQIGTAVFNLENNHFGVVFQLFRMDVNNQYLEMSKTVIVEFDETGNYIRSKGILEKINFDIQKAKPNNEGDIYFFGNLSEAYASKIDDNFNPIWSMNFGTENHNIYQNGTVTKDGGMILTGSRFRWTEPKGYNYYVVKTDCMGNTEWSSESCIIPNENEIAIFGNPVFDNLLIQLPQENENSTIQLVIYNSLGQVVLEKIVDGNIVSEDIRSFNQGVYIYSIRTSSQKNFKGKIVKN